MIEFMNIFNFFKQEKKIQLFQYQKDEVNKILLRSVFIIKEMKYIDLLLHGLQLQFTVFKAIKINPPPPRLISVVLSNRLVTTARVGDDNLIVEINF